MNRKQRLSASVDADLLEAGRAAVLEGRAENLSSWVNDALRRKADHDRRMRALDDFIAAYEADHGEITEQEMSDAGRRARGRAIVARGVPAPDRPSRRGPAGAAKRRKGAA